MKNTLKIVNKAYDVTKEFQDLIDSLNTNETLYVYKGTYLVTNLFLKSNMTLKFEDGATLISNTSGIYKNIYTRVAGINMEFYAAVLNVIDKENVKIIGKGIIDGKGEYFYNLYWGNDKKGGLRKEYDSKGIRFLADYDTNRVRNVLIQSSSNVEIEDIISKDSGFWNIHILYSNNIKVSKVVVDSPNENAPSTDGIDIDSSNNVLIENASITTNDDSIAIKSGRDADGIKTSIPSKNISINNCTINKGFGITIGSEVSGGIEDINISNIKYNNTDCGFRIKSSINRKGYIKNVNISNLSMNNVKYPIHINLDWNPLYSTNKMPEGFKGEMRKHYYKIIEEVDSNIENTNIDNINIDNLVCNSKGIDSRAFDILGFKDQVITNFNINNSIFNTKELGRLQSVDIKFNNVSLNIDLLNNKSLDEYDNR